METAPWAHVDQLLGGGAQEQSAASASGLGGPGIGRCLSDDEDAL